MIPIIASIGSLLLKHGLGLIKEVAEKKGAEIIKEKTGIDLNKGTLSGEELASLKKFQMDHEEEMQRLLNEGEKIANDLEIKTSEQATERARIDMSSGAWLACHIRPLVLAILTLATIAAVFVAQVTPEKLAALTGLDTWVYGYYFLGRTGEKGVFQKVAGAFRKH